MQQQRPAERSTTRHKPPMRVTTASAERKGVNLPRHPAHGAGEREHALRDAGTKQQSPPEREAKPTASPPTGTQHPGQARVAETGAAVRGKGASVPRRAESLRRAPSLRRRPGSEGCPTPGSASASRCPSHGSSHPQGVAGCRGIAHCCCGQRRAPRSEQPSERRRVWAPSGRFAGLGVSFFILLAKQLSKTPGCGKARTAQVPRRGPPCSTRSGEQKREQQGCKKEGKKKKGKKPKKDINSLGNPRPQGRVRVRGTTAHVTGDRQTDSPVPIRYVKYHHSGTLTDL